MYDMVALELQKKDPCSCDECDLETEMRNIYSKDYICKDEENKKRPAKDKTCSVNTEILIFNYENKEK